MVDIRTLIAKPKGDELFFIECPFHKDTGRPNMAVYPDGTKCFRCGASETASEFTERAKNQRIELAKRGGQNRADASAFEPWMVDVYHRILMNQREHRIQWFCKRGIWRSTVEKHRLGHTGEKFVIPVWDSFWNLHGAQYRIDPEYFPADVYYDEGPPKYLSPKGQKALVYAPGARNKGPVIICEGQLDALLLSQMHYNAVTTTGGAGSLATMLVGMRGTGIYVATDRDQAGDQAYFDILLRYPNAKRIPLPEGMDVTDYLIQFDPEERNDAWLHLVQSARRHESG